MSYTGTTFICAHVADQVVREIDTFCASRGMRMGEVIEWLWAHRTTTVTALDSAQQGVTKREESSLGLDSTKDPG